jgi:hypothetical protein
MTNTLDELTTVLDRAGLDYSDPRTVCAPLSIHAITVPDETTLAAWETLRDLVLETGHWPVVTGGKQRFQKGIVFISEATDFPDKERVQKILDDAVTVDLEAYYEERRDHFREVVEYDDGDDDPPLDFETELREVEGEWPEQSPSPIGFSLHLDPMPKDWKNRQPADDAEILLIPTKNCWEVPAYLDCGGWNECPETEVHVALFRQWYDQFGAEVIGVADDQTEMRVTRRPQTREDAEALAWEQYWYCEDVVDQGMATVRNLAAALLISDFWYFWWD